MFFVFNEVGRTLIFKDEFSKASEKKKNNTNIHEMMLYLKKKWN